MGPKITGTMRKVEPLPTPVATNSTRNMARNPAKAQERSWLVRKNSTPTTAQAMTPKLHRVTRAPPRRSANQPPMGRVMEPTSGPRKAYLMALGSANWPLMSRGRPAE